MPAEVFFTHSENAGTLTLAQLVEDLSRVGLIPRVAKDKEDQMWIEFEGCESRLLTMNEEPLGLITLQVYGDAEAGMALAEKIEAVLQSHGYVDAEQISG